MTGAFPRMPPRSPLAMPRQDFRVAHRDAAAPAERDATASGGRRPRPWIWRAAVLGPALAATAVLWAVIWGWFVDDGISVMEGLLIVLICFNFFWISFTLATVLAGFAGLVLKRGPPVGRAEGGIEVALLVPVHDEDPALVMGNARTMLEGLAKSGGPHRYALFVLSDTEDDEIAAAEEIAFEALRAGLPRGVAAHYRRLEANRERKVGNIGDWVRNWGGGWEAMLVLDADSLMTAEAIDTLADAMAADSSAGLIQSFPKLIGARSLFARMQQFGNRVHGAALAEGVARLAGSEGNYWGHNAILRTRAFAACAGLPPLPGFRGGGGSDRLIMSHDFVEAGLLARAGWTVRFVPQVRGSYEDTPQNLVDHVLRDRRWCQGNLQHLRILGARGFPAMSRFHLLHGAVSYLLSPIWFALLVIWALIGPSEEASVLTYFGDGNPLRPSWPEMTEGRNILIVTVMYAMLLAPKLVGMAAIPFSGQGVGRYGGAARLSLSMLAEIALAIVYAPILMVQQMIAVVRSITGIQSGWRPRARAGSGYGIWTVLKFHALETLSGAALLAGIAAGLVSLWLLPLTLSLALAVPLSLASGWSSRREQLMATDVGGPGAELEEVAQFHRAEIRRALANAKEREEISAPAA